MAKEWDVKWDKKKADKLVRKRLGALMEGIGVLVESQAVSIISVDQAVRRTTSGRQVAVTPATPGAPPRVLSARLRQSVTHETKVTKRRASTKIGTNVKYGIVHEKGDHPWLVPALHASRKHIPALMRRIGAMR